MKHLYALPIFILFLLLTTTTYSQNVGINEDNSNPDPSAILDVKSTSKGLLIPRMSTVQKNAIGTPVAGLLIYDLTDSSFWYYNGLQWQDIGSNGVIDTDQQTLSLSGTTLSISNGNSADLNTLLDNTDNQSLALTGSVISISGGNTIDLATLLVDAQTLSLSGNNLSISNGNTVDLSTLNTDAQSLTYTSPNLSISGGNSVDLSNLLDNTDAQSLSLTGNNLSISNGNTVDISGVNTDAQTLSFTSPNLSISGGNSVNLIGLSDNLGNHIATQNIQLNNNYLSNSSSNNGIRIDNSGNVAIGQTTPAALLDIYGTNAGTSSLLLRGGNTSASNNSAQILFGYNATTNYRHSLRSRHNSGSTSGNALDFYIWDYGTDASTTLGSKLVMSVDGNHKGMVGIGTSTPKSELHITDGTASSKAVTDAGGYGASVLITDNNIPRVYFEAGSQSSGKKLMDISYVNQVMKFNSLVDNGSTYDKEGILAIHRDGLVGINTYNPAAALHVVGSIRIVDGTQGTNKILQSDANGTASWVNPTVLGLDTDDQTLTINNTSAVLSIDNGNSVTLSTLSDADANTKIQVEEGANENKIRFDVNGTEALLIDNTGNIGLGATAPSYKLEVGISGDGTEARANAWNTFSDKRWKTDLQTINNALEKINAINGYFYKWKGKPDTTTQVGVIAQEIEAILPQIVATDKDGYKSVDYSKLTALLVQGIKEQQAQIQEQGENIKYLKQQVNLNSLKMDEMHAEMQKIQSLMETKAKSK